MWPSGIPSLPSLQQGSSCSFILAPVLFREIVAGPHRARSHSRPASETGHVQLTLRQRPAIYTRPGSESWSESWRGRAAITASLQIWSLKRPLSKTQQAVGTRQEQELSSPCPLWGLWAEGRDYPVRACVSYCTPRGMLCRWGHRRDSYNRNHLQQGLRQELVWGPRSSLGEGGGGRTGAAGKGPPGGGSP